MDNQKYFYRPPHSRDAEKSEAATISDPTGNVVCLALNFPGEKGSEHLEFYATSQFSGESPTPVVMFEDDATGNRWQKPLSMQQVSVLKMWCEGALAENESSD